MISRARRWSMGLLVALAARAAAQVDAPPPWLDRARESVALVTVPPRDGVGKRLGTAFVSGFDGTSLFLLTAGHVVWPPDDAAPSAEVRVTVDLRALRCGELSGIARRRRWTAAFASDLAVVRVPLRQLAAEPSRASCPDLVAEAWKLPRHVIEPRNFNDLQGTTGWFFGRAGESGGLDTRSASIHGLGSRDPPSDDPATDPAGHDPARASRGPATVRVKLGVATELKHGYSGAPLFSSRGHLIGMIVSDVPDEAASDFGTILKNLRDWADVERNFAGEFSFLTFKGVSNAEISVARRPFEPLQVLHPAPRGENIDVRLKVKGRPDVVGSVTVGDADLSCTASWVGGLEVAAARWRRTTFWTALALGAVGSGATALAFTWRSGFGDAPSGDARTRIRTANTVALASGAVAVAAGVASWYGSRNAGKTPGIRCEAAP